MKTGYQLREWRQRGDDDNIEDYTAPVGPEFETKVSLYNYAMATIPATHQMSYTVQTTFGPPDAYGVRDWEEVDWIDWQQEFEELTA